jgi:hypothetical protein
VDRLAAAPCSGSTGFLVIVRQPPSQNVGAVRPVISTTLQAALRQGLIKCCWWVCGRRALIHLMQNDGFYRESLIFLSVVFHARRVVKLFSAVQQLGATLSL